MVAVAAPLRKALSCEVPGNAGTLLGTRKGPDFAIDSAPLRARFTLAHTLVADSE